MSKRNSRTKAGLRITRKEISSSRVHLTCPAPPRRNSSRCILLQHPDLFRASRKGPDTKATANFFLDRISDEPHKNLSFVEMHSPSKKALHILGSYLKLFLSRSGDLPLKIHTQLTGIFDSVEARKSVVPLLEHQDGVSLRGTTWRCRRIDA